MRERLVEYRHGDAVLEGFMAWDETRSGTRPGVLVSHAWAGRGRFEMDKARALAALGYVGFALDMYGKGVLGTNPDQNRALMTPFIEDRAHLQARQQAALAALRAQVEVDGERTAALGFCFGGLCVLDLARSGAELRGVASFHGLLGKPGNTGDRSMRAKVLVLHGHDDPMAPEAQVQEFQHEMTAAKVDWQVHVYGGTMHSFTNPAANDAARGTVYNPAANRRAWATLVDFLGEVLT